MPCCPPTLQYHEKCAREFRKVSKPTWVWTRIGSDGGSLESMLQPTLRHHWFLHGALIIQFTYFTYFIFNLDTHINQFEFSFLFDVKDEDEKEIVERKSHRKIREARTRWINMIVDSGHYSPSWGTRKMFVELISKQWLLSEDERNWHMVVD